jgi:hypothetical protein
VPGASAAEGSGRALYSGRAGVWPSPSAPGSRHCVHTYIPVAHDRRAASLTAGTLRHALHVVRHRARQRRRLRGADTPRFSGYPPALPRHYAGICRGGHDCGVLLVTARPRCVASAKLCPCITLTSKPLLVAVLAGCASDRDGRAGLVRQGEVRTDRSFKRNQQRGHLCMAPSCGRICCGRSVPCPRGLRASTVHPCEQACSAESTM